MSPSSSPAFVMLPSLAAASNGRRLARGGSFILRFCIISSNDFGLRSKFLFQQTALIDGFAVIQSILGNAKMLKRTDDNTPLAAGVIIVTVLALSLGDALIKMTSGNFVIWQVFVLRSVLVIPVLLIILILRSPQDVCRPTAIGWTVARSLLLVGMWIAYYMSLPELDFSVAAAVYYTLPIFITLFSAVLIGDRIRLL
ncbi:MAG: EamA family transporter, partial [Pseudomonadota bacterium]